jgi:CheY-like chemotaxis protein
MTQNISDKKTGEYRPVDILIVEDNPGDAELIIRSVSTQYPACEVYVAEDGEEALDFVYCRGKFSGRKPGKSLKVIFLDIKLPKINGFEVLREIKSHADTKSIPVVIISSSREDVDVKEAYELGANAFVLKPLEYERFTAVMQSTVSFWLSVNELPDKNNTLLHRGNR